ncbi:hypothetical protein Tco_1146405 [Tanacetum coccineum]
MDGGDDGDDDNGDSSRDDANDEDEDEEEHLAPADSVVVIPTDELVSPPEGTKLVIPPPSTYITIGARITVRPQTSISLPPETSGHDYSITITTYLTITTLCRRAPFTVALPLPPLPPLPPSLYIPPPVDHRDDIPESEQSPHKRLCLSTLGSRYEIGKSSTARPTKDPTEAVPEIAPMTVEEVNTRVTKLAELHEHDTQDLYALLEDAQDSRSLISQRVDMDSQWVDLLMRDRMTLQETVWMVEEEAYASREAWAHLIGLSQATH